MAYTKANLEDLQQSLADRHDSGTLPTDSATLSMWTRLFNRGQEYCANELGLKTSTDLTTSGGSIALPDNFISVNDVYSEDLLMLQVSPDDVNRQVTGTYWITGDHDSGFTLNTVDDDTYTVKYTYHPTPLVNLTDECIIPDPEAVVAFAYCMLRKSETDPLEDADDAMLECDNRIKKIKSDYDSINANNEFGLEDM